MQQPVPINFATFTAPSFYITGRQPLRPAAILLAVVIAVGALCSVLYVLSHAGATPAGQRAMTIQTRSTLSSVAPRCSYARPPGRPRQPRSPHHPRSSAPLR